VPGHWEGDLIVGSNNSYIATLVERQSRFVMLAKVEAKDTQSVITALIKQARKLPKELYKSLTWDRGLEMAGQGTESSQSQQRSTSIFVIRSPHGRGAVTKTPTAFSDNTSRKALICRPLARLN
jgi:IS30 family transposase